MGKTPKPLSFLVHPSLVKDDADRQRLADLEAQGHIVHIPDPTWDGMPAHTYDLILGPNCWGAHSLIYLDLAIKSARAVKYPSGAKKVKAVKAKSPRKRKVKDAGVDD